MTSGKAEPKTVEETPDHDSEDGSEVSNAPGRDVPSNVRQQIAEQAKFAEDTASG